MSNLPELVTGDDVSLPVTLRKNEATFTIDPGATVKAAIVNHDHVGMLTEAITQLSTTPGADWANSLVVVKFASADTVGIRQVGQAEVEISVDDGGERTWFVTIDIVKGNI